MSEHGEQKAISRRGRPRMSLNLTPMIDVVFQLLVYFLVTASFLGDERLLRAEAPPADTARTRDDDPFSLESEPLDITVAREGAGGVISLSGGIPAPADADATPTQCAARMHTPPHTAVCCRALCPAPRAAAHTAELWPRANTSGRARHTACAKGGCCG